MYRYIPPIKGATFSLILSNHTRVLIVLISCVCLANCGSQFQQGFDRVCKWARDVMVSINKCYDADISFTNTSSVTSFFSHKRLSSTGSVKRFNSSEKVNSSPM